MRLSRLLAVLALAGLSTTLAATAAPSVAHEWARCETAPRATEAGLPGLDFPRDHPFAFEACTNTIRPGSQMTSPAGCTYSFILRDPSGNLYTGTAAHCVSRVGQRVSARGVGAFGTVVTDGALGVDYALIRVDADRTQLVNPTLCAWGGPIGADPGNRPENDVLLEYAWGTATNSNPFTRTRTLVEIARDANFVDWAGVGSGGDSGGPIVNAEGYAVGSHTYGLTPLVGVAFEGGPTFARMLASGRTAVPTLQLVTGDPTDVEITFQDLRAMT